VRRLSIVFVELLSGRGRGGKDEIYLPLELVKKLPETQIGQKAGRWTFSVGFCSEEGAGRSS
jgi:hypothetical protein